MISLGGSEKREISLASFQESNHDFSLAHFTADHYTDWNITAALKVKLNNSYSPMLNIKTATEYLKKFVIM